MPACASINNGTYSWTIRRNKDNHSWLTLIVRWRTWQDEVYLFIYLFTQVPCRLSWGWHYIRGDNKNRIHTPNNTSKIKKNCLSHKRPKQKTHTIHEYLNGPFQQHVRGSMNHTCCQGTLWRLVNSNDNAFRKSCELVNYSIWSLKSFRSWMARGTAGFNNEILQQWAWNCDGFLNVVKSGAASEEICMPHVKAATQFVNET